VHLLLNNIDSDRISENPPFLVAAGLPRPGQVRDGQGARRYTRLFRALALPMSPPSNAPQNLTDRVSDQIRRKLVDGELTPGQRLSENALSESLAISRNTLREAFRLLTKEGLL